MLARISVAKPQRVSRAGADAGARVAVVRKARGGCRMLGEKI